MKTEIIKVDKEHRIKVIHDEFDIYIPQWKSFIFWHNYKVYDCDLERYEDITFDSYTDSIEDVIEFMKEEDAKYENNTAAHF